MSDAGTNSYSQWSNLPNELLDMILSKMSIISILNFRAVCPSWRNAAKSHVWSLPYPPTHRAPWLMLSPILVGDTDFRFFSLEDNKVIKRVTRPHDMNIPVKFYNSLCLGSSHGWLVMLDENVVPYLFDPFHLTQIKLPYLDTVEVFKFPISDDGGIDIVPYNGPSESLLRVDSVHDFRELFYTNAVISANPYHSNGQFYVVMLASFSNKGRQLIFHRGGDIEVWMLLGDIDDQYCDIVCHSDRFYALNFPDSVEVWDTNVYTPERDYDSTIDAALPEKAKEIAHTLPNFGTHRAYLVESCGDLLLVLRYLGEYVDVLGRTIRGEDTYKTLLFLVFKLDCGTEEWVETESLGDQVLFIGGVQSMSFSGSDVPYCQPNSIYFSDDYWGKIREHTMRYDTGVFNMEDKSVRSFFECELGSEPPPFWVDPNILLDSWFWNAENHRQQI